MLEFISSVLSSHSKILLIPIFLHLYLPLHTNSSYPRWHPCVNDNNLWQIIHPFIGIRWPTTRKWTRAIETAIQYRERSWTSNGVSSMDERSYHSNSRVSFRNHYCCCCWKVSISLSLVLTFSRFLLSEENSEDESASNNKRKRKLTYDQLQIKDQFHANGILSSL